MKGTAMGDDHGGSQGVSPRALGALGALVVFALAAVALARLAGVDPDQSLGGTPVETRTLVFLDRADGAIQVVDGASGADVALLAPGEDNFIRGVLRGLVRNRKAKNVPVDAPLELQRHADGRVVLYDPATDEDMLLRAFGADNAATFARLLGPAL